MCPRRSIHGTDASLPDRDSHGGYPGRTRNPPPVWSYHRNLPVPDSGISRNIWKRRVLAHSVRWKFCSSLLLYILYNILTFFSSYFLFLVGKCKLVNKHPSYAIRYYITFFSLKKKLAFKTSGNYEKQNRILQIRSS